MDEGTLENSLLLIPNPYEEYKVIDSQTFNEATISVRTEGDDVPLLEAQRLTSNARKAVQLAQAIVEQEICWIKDGLNINIRKKGLFNKTLMNSSFDANHQLIFEEDATQTAAILHEIMEGVEEDLPNFRAPNNEILPLLSEFLFCGEKREAFFLNLTRQAQLHSRGEKVSHHEAAWGKSLELLAQNLKKKINYSLEPEEILSEVKKLKELDEKEKIDIIKSSIKEFESSEI